MPLLENWPVAAVEITPRFIAEWGRLWYTPKRCVNTTPIDEATDEG